MVITSNTSLPKYEQLRADILEDLSGLPYYSPIPSERELCERFNVSRPTVRKALELLEQERKIIKIQGKGSFFLGNIVHVDTSKRAGIAFYHEVTSLGNYTKSKVLLQNVEKPSREVAVRLNLSRIEEVFHLERLRYIDKELYSLANSYIPFRLCPELLHIDFSNISLYNTLEKYGIFPYRAEKVLEIKPASFYEAMHLQIEENAPVSVMQTLTYDRNDQLIEFSVTKSLAFKTRYEMIAYNE